MTSSSINDVRLRHLLANPYLIFALSFFLLAILFYRDGPKLESDGNSYFQYLKSYAVEGKINFNYNPFSVGPAILWTPFYAVGHQVALHKQRSGEFIWPNGYSYPYIWAICIGSLIYGCLGLVLLYLALRNFFSKIVSVWAVMCVLWGTPLVFYIAYEPSMSHAVSFFSVALFVFYALRHQQCASLLSWMVLGLTVGLMMITRWQNVIYTLILFPWFLTTWLKNKEQPVTEKAAFPLLSVALALVVFSPQILAWRAIYGSWLTMPQGSGFIRILHPHLISFLFSTQHGLLSWTPIVSAVLLALILLLVAYKKQTDADFKGMWKEPAVYLGKALKAEKPTGQQQVVAMGFFALLAVCIQVYLNSAVLDWWGGTSFGARRFISALVLCSAGIALVLHYIFPKTEVVSSKSEKKPKDNSPAKVSPKSKKRKTPKTPPVKIAERRTNPPPQTHIAFPKLDLGQRMKTAIAVFMVLCVCWNLILLYEYSNYLISVLYGFSYTEVIRTALDIVPSYFREKQMEAEIEQKAESLGIPAAAYDKELLEDAEVKDYFILDCGDEASSDYLVWNWGHPEIFWENGESFCWALEKESYALIPPLKKQEYALHLRAYPFAQNPQRQQTARVELNENYIGLIKCQRSMVDYQIEVLPQHLRNGFNTLKLSHAYSLIPRFLIKGDPAIGTTGVNSPVAIYIISTALSHGYLANIYINGKNLSLEELGYNLVAIHPQSGQIIDRQSFNAYDDLSEAHAMARYLKKLPHGVILALALKNEGTFLNLMRDEVVELFEFFSDQIVPAQESGWDSGVQSLFISAIDTEEAKIITSGRFDFMGSREEARRTIDFLKDMEDNYNLSVIVERVANHDLPAELIESIRAFGIEYSPFMAVAVGVKGAAPGTAFYSKAPYQENILFLGMSDDNRHISVAYDYIAFEPPGGIPGITQK